MKKEAPTKKRFIPGKLIIIFSAIMFIIPLSFFILLNSKTGSGFGFVEILFSISFSIIVILFLVWIKNVMKTRPYMGLFVGLLALAVFEYSLFFRYTGPYTITYAVITGLVVLTYLGISFVKNRKYNRQIISKKGFEEVET